MSGERTSNLVDQMSQESREVTDRLFDAMDALRAGKITPAEAEAVARAADQRTRKIQAQFAKIRRAATR
jgi:hypothetical protein